MRHVVDVFVWSSSLAGWCLSDTQAHNDESAWNHNYSAVWTEEYDDSKTVASCYNLGL